MGSFADQIRKWSEETEAGLDEVVREAVQEVGRRLIARSPIDSGSFVSNWNYSLEYPDYGTTSATHIRAVNHLGDLPKGASGFVHFIANGTPYGSVIERGGYPNPPIKGTGRTVGGFSTQAPQGVVALTQLEWPQIVAQSARRTALRRGFKAAVADAQAEGLL